MFEMVTILRNLGLLLVLSYGTTKAHNSNGIYHVERFPNDHQEQGNLFSEIKPEEESLSRTPYKVNNGSGTIWAVLVAGSNGYYNYRHQVGILNDGIILMSKLNIIVILCS